MLGQQQSVASWKLASAAMVWLVELRVVKSTKMDHVRLGLLVVRRLESTERELGLELLHSSTHPVSEISRGESR